MSDRAPIFRSEALEYRARMQGPGGVLRLGPQWTSWAFWVLLGLVLAALATTAIVDIDRYETGTTTRDTEGNLVVLLPAAAVPEVKPGALVDLGASSAEVVSSGQALEPAEVTERFGLTVPAPVVPLTTSAPGGEASGLARVLVGSDPMIVALVPGLQALFGGGDG